MLRRHIAGSAMNRLLYAARPLLGDFLSTIAFAALVALHVDPVVAVGAAMAVGVGQIVTLKLRGRPVAPLQWMSLGLVLTFGLASLVTQDPRFVMAKPTIAYIIVGVVMLKRGWMLRYLPPEARRADDVMIAFGYVWAGLMFLTAVANLAAALAFTRYWPAFIAVVPLTSKILLFAVQYATIHATVKRRMRVALTAGEASTAA
jgi:intracellular septation protein A